MSSTVAEGIPVKVKDLTVKDITVKDLTVKDITVKDLTVKDITLEDIMFTLGSFQTLPQHLQDELVLRPLRVDDHLKGITLLMVCRKF